MKYNYNGVDLFYEVKGCDNGEAVAFFNGVMASTNSWYGCIPPLEKLGYKCILHDFKGQMRSDKPATSDSTYSFEQHAIEAKALFDHLGVTSVNIIGTSYGGEVGMKFASMYPDMVKTLIVIDSVSELDPVCEGFVVGWKALCDTHDGEKFFWGMMPSIYGAEFISNNMDMLTARAKATGSVDPAYLVGQKILYDTFVNDVYMTDQLHKIVCPTLVICGQDDILKPPKFSDIIYRNITNCEYVIFPHCGHVTIFEQQETLNTNIVGFLTKNK